MIYVMDLLNIIDTFLAFTILDRFLLKNRKIQIGALLLLIVSISVQLKLIIPAVPDLFFAVLLLALSYLNRREQPIGVSLFRFVVSYSIFILNNFLLYPRAVWVYLLLKAPNWQPVVYVLLTVSLGVAFSFFVRKFVIERIALIWQNRFGYLFFLLFLSSQGIALYQYLLAVPEGMERMRMLELMFSLSILLIAVLIFSVAVFSSNQKLAFEKKEKVLEQQVMQLYMDEVSNQNQVVRQFKHDYLNILSSLEGYMASEDMAGLKCYYEEGIQPTRQVLATSDTRLADLQKIQHTALRSLLTAKILLAQEKGVDIHLEVEALDLKLAVNELVLIRIVGILLDNAIEELEELGEGCLEVAFFSKGDEVNLMIRNSVREVIEPLHQLKKAGYSTKGENGGLGLSTVEKLVNQTSVLLLETTIESNAFLQNLTILGGNHA